MGVGIRGSFGGIGSAAARRDEVVKGALWDLLMKVTEPRAEINSEIQALCRKKAYKVRLGHFHAVVRTSRSRRFEACESAQCT